MIKVFLKISSVKVKEESPSVETVGVQFEEEEDDEKTKLFSENNENNAN